MTIRLFAEDLEIHTLFLGQPVHLITPDHVVGGGIHFVSPSRGTVAVDSVRMRAKDGSGFQALSFLPDTKYLSRGDSITITFSMFTLLTEDSP